MAALAAATASSSISAGGVAAAAAVVVVAVGGADGVPIVPPVAGEPVLGGVMVDVPLPLLLGMLPTTAGVLAAALVEVDAAGVGVDVDDEVGMLAVEADDARLVVEAVVAVEGVEEVAVEVEVVVPKRDTRRAPNFGMVTPAAVLPEPMVEVGAEVTEAITPEEVLGRDEDEGEELKGEVRAASVMTENAA